MNAPYNKGKGKTIEWLRAHVSYQGNDCLPWPFAKDSRVGRGLLGYNGGHYWAHRLMCEMAHGAPPTKKHQAAHNCGKGHYGCCNPKHLEWKTNSANQLDRRKNGNMLRNQHGNKGALSPAQIDLIRSLRASGTTQVAIAKQLGVSLGCVQYWLKYRAARGNDQGKLRAFSDAETEMVRQMLANDIPRKEIARRLGRTVGSVEGRIRRMVA